MTHQDGAEAVECSLNILRPLAFFFLELRVGGIEQTLIDVESTSAPNCLNDLVGSGAGLLSKGDFP